MYKVHKIFKQYFQLLQYITLCGMQPVYQKKQQQNFCFKSVNILCDHPPPLILVIVALKFFLNCYVVSCSNNRNIFLNDSKSWNTQILWFDPFSFTFIIFANLEISVYYSNFSFVVFYLLHAHICWPNFVFGNILSINVLICSTYFIDLKDSCTH